MNKIHALLLASLLIGGSVWADDSFFSEAGGYGDDASSSVMIGGSITAAAKFLATEDALKAVADLDNEADTVEVSTGLDLTLNYEGSDFSVYSDLSVSPDAAVSGSDDSVVTVNEAYARYFGEGFSIEAGLMKVVWGKADEFHVVDVLNNVNLSEFLVPDYLEMMDPELIFKLNIPVGMAGNLELAYVPVLTADRFAGSGSIWEPIELKTELPARLAYFSSLGLTVNPLPEVDTHTLDYSQGALRFTSSAGGFDYGFTYYAGYNKMPTVNFVQDGAVMNFWKSYDPLHIFGVEMGYILAGFNFKGEFAYHMTYDFDGDDARIHNNSIRWVGGFDRDIPLGNLNINIQETGSLILKSDNITAADIEYDADGTYTQNMLIVAVTDKFFHEKLETKLIGFYHFEESDYGIYPQIGFSPADDFTMSLEGRFFGGEEETFFGQYKDNNFVEMSFAWNF